MSDEMKKAYKILRTKDEVVAGADASVPAALLLVVAGVALACAGDGDVFLGAISIAVGVSCAAWHRFYAKWADIAIRRLGFTEVELERWDLA